MRLTVLAVVMALLCVCALSPVNGRATAREQVTVERVVSRAVRPLMAQYGIPGMAVGIVVNGRTYIYNYGVASKATEKPVADSTLFEIGSISKTFTATLASYAQVMGRLSLSDRASTYLPTLRGSDFGNVSLLNLGTHTPGGIPLQVPSDVTNETQLMTYFQNWIPAYAPGTYRTYSNVGIGTLGLIAAKSMNGDFGALMVGTVFRGLGLRDTYLDVPKAATGRYAQGYTSDDAPIRMAPGVLGKEAYGVRTTASDLLRFVEANMGMVTIDERLQRAITGTHMGYYRIGAMTQDLIWEQFRYPLGLTTLQAGNSPEMLFDPNPALAIDPPLPPEEDVLINKTGSTNGFGAYVAFVPSRKIGIVLLANRSYPISARVNAAYRILTQLSAAQ